MIRVYYRSGKEEVISEINEVIELAHCLKRIEIDNHVFIPKRRDDCWETEMESQFCIWSDVYQTCSGNDVFYVYYLEEKARWIIDEVTFKIVAMDSLFMEGLKKECIEIEKYCIVPHAVK